MEAAGRRIGVVSALVGIRRWRIRAHGAANHAGTTPMAMRRDAGIALIELAAAANAEFRRLADRDTVWNVGNMMFRPGAANVVPGEAEMLVEFRDIKTEVLDRLEARFLALVADAGRGAVGLDVEPLVRIPPTAMAEHLGAAIAAAASARGETPVHLPSGAGHDAMVAARFMPAAMMFVPSIGGISHDVRENTADADIIFGCEVLADAVAQVRRQV
jgi:N-carbamoyl-L-amino-acid hydrolase